MSRTGAALAVLLIVQAVPAPAQERPSAAEITRSLLPKGVDPDLGADRGLRRNGLTAEPAQDGAPAPAATGGIPPAPAPVVNLSVAFQSGSATLAPAARQTLDELGRALSGQALSRYRFRIEGHTDTTGNPAVNLALSGRRAAAVVDYLATKFGVDRARLEAVGKGDTALLVPTGPQVSEPRNRRVQVVNTGP